MSCFGCSGSLKSGSWTKVGPGSTHLYQQVETLYWTGVEEELENIIRTLRSWQREENSGIQIDDETDENIHGYDTFLGQVSSGQRAFAKRYGDWKEEEAARNIPNQRYNPARYQPMKPSPVPNQDQRDSYNEEATKIEVEKSIASIPRLSGLQNRACMLLQAAGFLDIDKLVEHRAPLEDWGFWARPAMPQMKMTGKEECTPKFGPLHCQKAECHRIIRGSMFVKKGESTETICESCYRASPHGRSSFKKVYKHCILPEVITPEISREMCACQTVPHDDQNGQIRSLFPVEIDEKHTDEEANRCKLLDLGRNIALAKLHGLEDVVEEQVAEREEQEKLKNTPSKFESFKRRLFTKKESEREEEERQSQTEPDPIENPAVTSEAEADGDIPFFFRQYAQQYPFGNVHMALRVGPLVIENGVPNTKGGALISLREYPVFHDRPNIGGLQRRLAIVEDEERNVWGQEQRHEVETRKRYKAVMKQVVGAPFTGLLSSSEDAEQQKRIIELLIEGSQQRFDDAGLHQKKRSSLLRDALKPVMERLKNLLGHRVKIYLSSVVYQLLNAKTSLRWSRTSNNCQTFCNNLIENSIFGSLTTGGGVEGPTSSSSLYLMSFVCPQEGYLKNRVRTKYDVPCGLTEEYLLKFHFGRHDEVDIIDDLQEYWYDWGAFGALLYKNQDLFPWDCSEAYGRCPTKCNDCNLAKHIWAFPFDSWSMVELHLHRDSQMYPSSDGKWMENRLKVLAAASLLARAAAGMVRSKRFRDETEWLSPMSEMSLNKEPGLVRVKLGGIHRAQPFSHYFEAGRYFVYFQAEWAIRNRPQQIIEYEALRDERMKRKELGGGGGGGSELSTSNNIDPHDAAMLEQQFQSFFGLAMAEIEIPTAGESDAHNQNHDDNENHTERDQDPVHSTASTTNSGHDSDATSHVSSQHDETVDDHTTVSTPSAPTHTAGSSSHQPSSRHSGRDDTSDVGSLPNGFNHLHSYNHRSKPSGSSSYHPSSSHDQHSSTNDHHSYSPSYSSASYSSPSHSSTSYSSPSYSSPSYSSPSYSSPSYSSPSYGGTSSSHGHSSTSYGGTSSSYGGSSSRGGGSNSYSNDY